MRSAHNGFAEGLMRAIALGFHRALAVRAVRAFVFTRQMLAAFICSKGRLVDKNRPV